MLIIDYLPLINVGKKSMDKKKLYEFMDYVTKLREKYNIKIKLK